MGNTTSVMGAFGLLILTGAQHAYAEGVINVTVDQVPANYVRVPTGLFKHPSCVIQVPNGSVINPNWDITVGGKVVEHVDPNCNYPTFRIGSRQAAASSQISPMTTYSGSLYANYYVGANGENNPYGKNWIDRFTGSWNVPSSNPGSGQIDLWIGLQPTDASFVIQPVVQSAFNGGWEMFVAYVPNVGNVIESVPIPVNLGDSISGSLDTPRTYPPGPSCNSQGLCMWLVTMYDNTTGTSAGIWVNLTPSVNRPMTYVYGAVLEFPSISGCSDFPPPGSTQFTSLTAYVPSPTYTSFQALQFNPYPNGQPMFTPKRNPNPLQPDCGWAESFGTNTISLSY